MATPMWINEHDAWEFLFRFTEAYHLRGHLSMNQPGLLCNTSLCSPSW